MNPILEKIIEARKGHYCHDLEVNQVYEIECVVEAIISEFPDNSEKDVIEFFQSITLHYLGDDDKTEQEIYNFDFKECVDLAFWSK